MRIRTVKPEFYTHEGLFDLEKRTKLPVRLAFTGLWCAADREGRFKWEPRRLGVLILPYDNIDFEKVLSALAEAGFIVRYGDSGRYVYIPGFLKHQCVNTREAKSILPEPSVNLVQHHACNLTPAMRQAVFDRDGNKCVRCGSFEDLTADHIFPQSIGGTHVMTNLRTMCRPCNSARPTSGQALTDDLAKDGFSRDDMKRTCMHVTGEVHAQGEGKGREGKGMEGDCAEPEEPAAAPKEPVLVFPCAGSEKEWSLSEEKLSEWQETYDEMDVLEALRHARQWCRDNSKKRKTAQGMPRFLGTWLATAQNKGQHRKGTNSAPASYWTPTHPDAFRPQDELLREAFKRTHGDNPKAAAVLEKLNAMHNGGAAPL